MMKSLRLAMLAIVALLAGCAGPQRNVDYTAFRESKPASILVLPPLNTSVDVAASAAVLSQATLPLAESGYYVVPVAVMEETFRQNGLTTPDDIHAVPARLREIFGRRRLVHDRQGIRRELQGGVERRHRVHRRDAAGPAAAPLWDGHQTLRQGSSSNSGGLIGMLVQAVVDQVVNSLSDRSYGVAGMTSNALLSAGTQGGILYGPRSPRYAGQ